MSEIQVGDTMSFRKTLTVAEQAMFTGISGNMAPLYVDRRAARDSGFDDMLAFELNALGLATTALNRLAGPAWRLGGLQVDFVKPVVVGATVEARVEVTARATHGVSCALRCTLPDGALVARGTATLVPVKAEA